MKNAFKILTACFFVLELILPSMASAKMNHQFTPLMLDKLPATVKNVISAETAKSVFLRYRMVKTARDFQDLFLSQLTEKDRREVLENFYPLKEYPALTLQGRSLTFQFSHQSFKLEFLEPWNQAVRINGKLWHYSPRISVKKNIENLAAFLEKSSRVQAGHPLWNLLVPEAHALGPLLVGAAAILAPVILIAVVTGAGKVMMDATCAWAKEKHDMDLREYYVPGCSDYFKSRAELDKQRLGTFDSFMNFDTNKELREKYDLDSLKCPTAAIGTAFTFKAKIRRSATNPEAIAPEPLAPGNILSSKSDPFITGSTPVPVTPAVSKEGTIATPVPTDAPKVAAPVTVPAAVTTPAPAPVDKASLRAWSQVLIKVRANGTPDEIVITPEDIDPQSSSADNNIIFRIKYNTDGTVEKVGLRNNLYRRDDGSPPVLWYGSTDVAVRINESKSSTEQEANLTARLAKAIEMVAYLKERTKECRQAERPSAPKTDDSGASDGTAKTGTGSK